MTAIPADTVIRKAEKPNSVYFSPQTVVTTRISPSRPMKMSTELIISLQVFKRTPNSIRLTPEGKI